MEKIVFINGSPNKNGNTAMLVKTLANGNQYETLHLVDYKVYSYGQEFEDDQLDEVISKMKEADTIIIGSPLYWHNICGAVRDVLDRCYGVINQGEFKGKKLFFVYQGALPEKWMLEAGDYTMRRFASLYGMDYIAMITNKQEAQNISL